MEDVFAKIGLKFAHLITGLIGGGIALVFGKARPTLRDKIKAVVIVLLGAVATGYLTPLLLLWKPSLETVEHGIAFVVGIFGMGIIEGLINLVRKFQDNPMDIIKEIKQLIKK